MAKPREITGLDCSRKSLAWASKVLLTRFDEMTEFRHTAVGFAEIKGVHDMRVATRRLSEQISDPVVNMPYLRFLLFIII